MQHWEMLYERQPFSWDVALFAVALLIHAPLMTLHMRAPKQHGKASRLVNVDYIEQQIQKRKEKPQALPPAAPTKKLEDKMKQMEKKMKEQVKEKVFKRTLPPPPPPVPKIPDQLIKDSAASKLETKKLEDKLNQDKKILQSKNGFNKDMNLSNPNANRDLKLGGGAASAIQTNSRVMAGGSQGPALKGKGSFQVSKDAMPESIGGDNGGGLKMGGESNIVVVPVGARARGDASIMSPVAKNKGSLQSSGPNMAMASAGSAPGIAGGGGAGSIAIGGSSRGPAIAAPEAAIKSSKKFDGGSIGNSGASSSNAPAMSAPAGLPIIPRRTVTKKPMFQITGPLANRQVVSREIPEYPDWARSKGIEAAVVLQFTVSPEGNVKDNVFVVRTTGYPQMDNIAVQALKKWKFAPLPADQYRDEVGNITFNFSVR